MSLLGTKGEKLSAAIRNSKDAKFPVQNEIIFVGGKEVEVLVEVPFEEFESGFCFLVLASSFPLLL